MMMMLVMPVSDPINRTGRWQKKPYMYITSWNAEHMSMYCRIEEEIITEKTPPRSLASIGN